MTNESFSEFAESFQKEIEAETGITFGMFQINLLVGQTYEEETKVEKTVSIEQAAVVVKTLKFQGIIDEGGKVVATAKPIAVKSLSIPEPSRTRQTHEKLILMFRAFLARDFLEFFRN